MFKVKDGQ